MLPNASENDSLTDRLPDAAYDATSTSFISISRNFLGASPAVIPCRRAEAKCLPFSVRRKRSGLWEPWSAAKYICWMDVFDDDQPLPVKEDEFEAPKEKL